MVKEIFNYHIIVSGRVQGVGFRYFTKKMADELSIYGWVKNMGDGTVEITAEGAEQLLEDFLKFIKRGPSFSRVKDTRVSKIRLSDYKYSDFKISY